MTVDGASVVWLDGALVVTGEIDTDTCGTLRVAIAERVAGGRIVIDMSACTFCDSSCLGCLLIPARSGVTVVVRRPSSAVRKVLAITGIDQLVELED